MDVESEATSTPSESGFVPISSSVSSEVWERCENTSKRKRSTVTPSKDSGQTSNTSEKFLEVINKIHESVEVQLQQKQSATQTKVKGRAELFCERLCLSLKELDQDNYEEAEIEIMQIVRKRLKESRKAKQML